MSNDPVEDVSADNDWSLVRVCNLKTGGWGGTLYPVQGFIGGRAATACPTSMARTAAESRRRPPWSAK